MNLASFGEVSDHHGADEHGFEPSRGATDDDRHSHRLSQYSSILDPVITATEGSDNALLQVKWPAQAETDIRSLVAIFGSLVGDMQALRVITHSHPLVGPDPVR